MDRSGSIVDSYSPLETACDSLQKGGILSVKANDGFITLCNALDNNAILELRRRKKLFNKPVSIMARDIEIVKKYCYCSEEEEKLLTSPAAPVVILKPLPGIPLVTANICPDYPETMGVALPPTAMLRLLFESRPTPDSLHGQFDLFAFVGGPKPVDPDIAAFQEKIFRIDCGFFDLEPAAAPAEFRRVDHATRKADVLAFAKRFDAVDAAAGDRSMPCIPERGAGPLVHEAVGKRKAVRVPQRIAQRKGASGDRDVAALLQNRLAVFRPCKNTVRNIGAGQVV